MFRIKFKGIYSTALTKLLLDHKRSIEKRNFVDLVDQSFEIVHPSFTVEERFEMKGNGARTGLLKQAVGNGISQSGLLDRD